MANFQNEEKKMSKYKMRTLYIGRLNVDDGHITALEKGKKKKTNLTYEILYAQFVRNSLFEYTFPYIMY